MQVCRLVLCSLLTMRAGAAAPLFEVSSTRHAYAAAVAYCDGLSSYGSQWFLASILSESENKQVSLPRKGPGSIARNRHAPARDETSRTVWPGSALRRWVSCSRAMRAG